MGYNNVFLTGTLFAFFQFKRHRKGIHKFQLSRERGEGLQTHAENVLLVDDNDLLLSSMKRFLAKDFPYVMDARTGEEAIVLIKHQLYDIAVIDINLPGIDGWEVFEHLKERSPQSRIIIITSGEDEELKEKTMSKGAVGFLAKPFSLDELKSIIEKALSP